MHYATLDWELDAQPAIPSINNPTSSEENQKDKHPIRGKIHMIRQGYTDRRTLKMSEQR